MALFGKSTSELEYKNKLLLEVDKKRVERLNALEDRLDEVLNDNKKLQGENEALRNLTGIAVQSGESKASEKTAQFPSAHAMAALVAERDFYKKQKFELDDLNSAITDAATRYSLWAQELDRLLAHTGQKEAERRQAWVTHVEKLGVVYRTHKADTGASG